jgi:transposase
VDWQATPASVAALLVELSEENKRLAEQVGALATRVAQLEEQKGRSSRNSSKPPSSDEPGQRGFGGGGSDGGKGGDGKRRKRGGQAGHPGHSRDLLPTERCDQVFDHHPAHCGNCGGNLLGAVEGVAPWRHQVVDLPPVKPIVMEHRLHQLICPCCQSATRAVLPDAAERSGFGARLSALVRRLGSTYHLSHLNIQRFVKESYGVRISIGGISCIRRRLNSLLEEPVADVHRWLRDQPILQADETSWPVGNSDGNNPDGRGGWIWVLRNASATVFSLRLSRSKAAAQELIGANFLGILICDRYGAYNCLPLEQRQFCWAHLRRDLIAMAERSGVSEQIGRALLGLQSQLFESWHAWLDQRISRAELEASSTDIRQAFQAKLEWAVNLGCSPGETTPLARTIGTCRKLLNSLAGLWTFLFHPEVELTNNASERALRPVVIARKLSTGVQSAWGGEFLGRIMSMATTLEQQGREGIEFLMELINANREGRPSPSLIPVSS